VHVDFVFGLVFLSEIGAAKKADSVEMRNYCYFGVGFPIFHKNLFHFAGPISYILCLFSHILAVHKLGNAVRLLMVVLAFNFFQKLKVSLLVLQRVVFDKPKLSFGFYF
jgi:hypothetical protein